MVINSVLIVILIKKTIFLDNVMILKNKIQKFFNLFGYRLEKINNKHKNDLDFFTVSFCFAIYFSKVQIDSYCISSRN